MEPPEERERRMLKEHREYTRLQARVRNAQTEEEHRVARKAFDDYLEGRSAKREATGESRRRTRKRSRRWTMRPQPTMFRPLQCNDVPARAERTVSVSGILALKTDRPRGPAGRGAILP